MNSTAMVFVIDNDQSMRKSLQRLLDAARYKTEVFKSASEFLSRSSYPGPSCVIVDVKMPGLNGIDFQEALIKHGREEQLVFITAHGDIPMCAQVMKAGAIDFLTKPFNDQVLLESINKALRLDKSNRERRQESAQARAKFALLSPREVQVLQGIVAGKPNKVISAELNISLKTVEAHRASVMKKMGVKSVPELVKLVLTNSIQEETVEEE